MSAVREYLKVLVDSAVASRGVNLQTYRDKTDILMMFTSAWINYVQALNEDEDTEAQLLYNFIMDLLDVASDDTDRDLTISQQKTAFAYK